MELESLLKLIEKVSSSEISDFKLEEGNIRLSLKKDKKEVYVAGPEASSASLVQPAVPKEAGKAGGQVMKAPLVGTFYNASSPDAEPFVKPGDPVKKGQVLGIIEAMKLMNEIESEFDGTLEEVLVENNAMVEYGQPIFRIR